MLARAGKRFRCSERLPCALKPHLLSCWDSLAFAYPPLSIKNLCILGCRCFFNLPWHAHLLPWHAHLALRDEFTLASDPRTSMNYSRQLLHPFSIKLSISCLLFASVITFDSSTLKAGERIELWPGKTSESQAVITVHLPSRPNGAAIVICPGGGYGTLVTGPEGHGVAKWLNENGIAGIVLEYELPRGRSQLPLADAQQALRVVRANATTWNIDPRRVGIMGFSAGGHLASTAGTHYPSPLVPDPENAGDGKPAEVLAASNHCRPDFMVLVYPVITMGEQTHTGSRRNLLGDNPSSELIVEFSNEKQVTADTPPAFLVHAKDDRVVVPENSEMFHAALKEHGVETQYLELPSGGHGLNGYQGPMWTAWQTGLLKWLADQEKVPAVDRQKEIQSGKEG